jgi:ABC-type uncharacterized transport system substrate-binding protein
MMRQRACDNCFRPSLLKANLNSPSSGPARVHHAARRGGFVAARGAWAQQQAVVGFLNTQSPEAFAYLVTGFRQGLRETGYVEGGNLTIEYRWAENQYDRLPALAADLVRSQVSVIAATGGSVSPLAAKGATGTIPIVFLAGDLDAVQAGLVASIKRPGGNVTGVIPLISALGAKRLEFLHEMLPKAECSLTRIFLMPKFSRETSNKPPSIWACNIIF